MKTIIKLVIVLGLVLAMFSQHTVASAGTQFKFKGDSADAFFESTDGCLTTFVFVVGSDNMSPGQGSASSYAGVSIFKADTCTGEILMSASGSVPLDRSDFEITGGLGSATLNATVTVFDAISGSSFDVFIDVVWTAFGPRLRQSSSSQIDFPDCKISTRFRGTSRQAEAKGTISDGTANLVPETGGGQILQAKSGEWFVGCGV